MKIIVTTSNSYLHIVPIFSHLYNKYWGSPFELVGYDRPKFDLPKNCTWVSLGKQGDKKEFSSDMHRYFSVQPDHFVWLMEDCFLKDYVKIPALNYCMGGLTQIPEIGRISLTIDSHKYYSEFYFRGYYDVFKTPQDSFYRLSIQPAIWRKEYLLKHLTPGLDPWKFETQTADLKPEPYFLNVTLEKEVAPVTHNEGVRKRNIHEYNFDGLPNEVIAEMKTLKLL